MCGTLTYVKQKTSDYNKTTKTYLPDLRFFNASNSFSRVYYMDLQDLGFDFGFNLKHKNVQASLAWMSHIT